jgi:hypothetical protein
MFIPDPGSEFFSIPDDPHQLIKYFNPKNGGFQALGNMIRVIHPGSGSRILIFYPSRIQGSKRHRIPDPQHCFM